ncbi:YqhA family protein, partial [Flavobacteriales bacterium]|nr:YqhA family protein [Flavobacteriales bacterium]
MNSSFENKFEKALWSLRYVVILSVILSILSSIALFVIGSWDILQAIIFKNPLFDPSITNNNDLLFGIISSIDLFLIGIVLLIFGFGVYELFI